MSNKETTPTSTKGGGAREPEGKDNHGVVKKEDGTSVDKAAKGRNFPITNFVFLLCAWLPLCYEAEHS